jgi:acyl-CoA dehydrogenase-like protein
MTSTPARLANPGDAVMAARELASGAGATALVFNMHASVTGAMAQTPDDVVRAEHVTQGRLDSLPTVRARLGRAAAAELTVLQAARKVDQAPGTPETNRWVWRAKLIAGATAAAVASSLLEAAGTSASRRGHPLERLYRDARCGALQPATSDVCADWLGLATLGADPDNQAGIARW